MTDEGGRSPRAQDSYSQHVALETILIARVLEHRGKATINEDDLTGAVGVLLGSEEEHLRAQFLGTGEVLDAHAVHAVSQNAVEVHVGIRRRIRAGQVRHHDTGGNGVDENAILCELGRQGTREIVHATLCRVVAYLRGSRLDGADA